MDVKCMVCGEPWSYWGLFHGDVMAWEADCIRDGKGCPACYGHPPDGGYEPSKLSDYEWGDEDPTPRIHAQPSGDYEAPPLEVLEECVGCGVQRVRDRSAEVYDGSRREPVYAWYAPYPSDAQRWQVEHDLSCYDAAEPMAQFYDMGPVCAHCHQECADCDTLIATHNQGAFGDLETYDAGASFPLDYELFCVDCYSAELAQRQCPDCDSPSEYDDGRCGTCYASEHIRDIVCEDELVEALLDVARSYEGSGYIDVRLRVYGESWELLEGSSQYDTNHRGAWGAGSVWPRMSEQEATDVARDLVSQVAS